MTRNSETGYRDVDPVEAERLVAAGEVRVLDVRNPGEYETNGHIPGALLLPVDLIASGPATLPGDGKPLLVHCEHGVRSVHAARFLAQAGVANVINMKGGFSCWNGPTEHGAASPETFAGPATWLLENGDLLPQGGAVLDLACGAGRHALLLAAAGFQVQAVDADAAKIAALAAAAARLGLSIQAEHLDLESVPPPLQEETHDVILVISYLHRPLFPALVRALKPGGLLIYETFTIKQAERGKPTNPDFLLQEGELGRLVAPLEVLREREGEYEGRMVAGVAARKPG